MNVAKKGVSLSDRIKREITAIEFRSDLTSDQKVKQITHVTCAACAGIAIQPIPFADIFILTPIQAYMGSRIAAIRGVPISESEASLLIKEIFGVIGMGFMAQQIALGIWKTFIPGAGGFMTIPIVYSLSYAIMRVMDAYMVAKASNRQLSDDEIKKLWKMARQEGKSRADEAQNINFEDVAASATKVSVDSAPMPSSRRPDAEIRLESFRSNLEALDEAKVIEIQQEPPPAPPPKIQYNADELIELAERATGNPRAWVDSFLSSAEITSTADDIERKANSIYMFEYRWPSPLKILYSRIKPSPLVHLFDDGSPREESNVMVEEAKPVPAPISLESLVTELDRIDASRLSMQCVERTFAFAGEAPTHIELRDVAIKRFGPHERWPAVYKFAYRLLATKAHNKKAIPNAP